MLLPEWPALVPSSQDVSPMFLPGILPPPPDLPISSYTPLLHLLHSCSRLVLSPTLFEHVPYILWIQKVPMEWTFLQ